MKSLILLTVLFCYTLQAEQLIVEALNRTTPVNFNKEIYPFFKRNCLACHNNSKAKAKLVLETAEDIRKGSSNGPVVIPGNAQKSLLFTTSAHIVDEDDIMPPENNKSKAENLTSRELGLLKLWIDQGAKGSGAVIAEAPDQWLKYESGQPVYAIAVSPDGRYAASGHGHNIDIYDLRLKIHLTRINDPGLKDSAHLDLVRSLAFDKDNTLASGGYRKIKLWSQVQITPKPYRLNEKKVKGAVATSKDGSWSLFLNKEKTELSKVDKNGKSEKIVFKEKIALAVILHNRNEVAVAFEKGKIRVMKPAAFAPGNEGKKELYYEWQAHSKRPTHLLNDEKYPLISCDLSGRIILWNLKTRKPVRTFNNNTGVSSISLNKAKTHLVATSRQTNVFLWDMGKPQKYLKNLWDDPNNQLKVAGLKLDQTMMKRNITRYGNRIKKINETIKKEKESAEKIEKEFQDKTKELKELIEKKLPELQAKKPAKDAEKKKNEEELKTLQEEIQKLTARLPSLQKNKSRSLEMHNRAKKDLVKAEQDKKNCEAGVKSLEAKIKDFYKQHTEIRKRLILGAAFAADDSFFAVAYENGDIHLYSADGAFIETVKIGKSIKNFSIAGDSIITTAKDGTSEIRSVKRTWTYSGSIGDGKDGRVLIDRVTALGFGLDSTLVSASGIPSRQGQLKLWDLKTLKLKAADVKAHADLITGIQFSPDRKKFVTGSADGIAKIYDAASLKSEKSLEGHSKAVLDVAWSGDGWLIATASADKQVILWNTETGEKYKTLLGKGQEVTVVKFMSRTSEGLLTAEGVGVLNANLKSLPGKFKYAFTASLTPDESMILAGGQSGIIHLWDAQKYNLIKSFKPGMR